MIKRYLIYEKNIYTIFCAQYPVLFKPFQRGIFHTGKLCHFYYAIILDCTKVTAYSLLALHIKHAIELRTCFSATHIKPFFDPPPLPRCNLSHSRGTPFWSSKAVVWKTYEEGGGQYCYKGNISHVFLGSRLNWVTFRKGKPGYRFDGKILIWNKNSAFFR